MSSPSHMSAILEGLVREFRARGMAKFTAGMILLGVVLRVLDWLRVSVSGLVQAFFVLGLMAAGVYYLVRLGRYVRDHLLWRLSRRLAMTYLLIAFVPVVLILILMAVGAVTINGQFAAFLVRLRLQNHFDELLQLNRVVAHEAVYARYRNATELVEGLEKFYVTDLKHYAPDFPALRITLRCGRETRGFTLTGQTLPRVIKTPEWMKQEEWAGFAEDRDEISLRAIDRESTSVGGLTIILSLPVTPALLNMVGKDIGPVAVLPFIPRRRIHELPAPRSRVRVVGLASAVQSNAVPLPPAESFLDLSVRGASAINPVIWNAPRKLLRPQPVLVSVRSRIFALNRQLLETLGKLSILPVIIFAAVALVLLVIELVSLVLGIKLARSITVTVDRLYKATEKVKAGDLTHRINLPAHDQVSALGEAFNTMTASVERLMAESREKTRLESELKIAREVQARLFPPSPPSAPGLELYGACEPAREVSGDYYDFLLLGDGQIGLVVGDVSGKGIYAALLMAALQSALRAQCYDGFTPPASASEAVIRPAKVTARLNRQLYESTQPEKYATFFFAVCDPRRRTLTYTNAGHPSPFLFRGGSILRLDTGGTVLGLFPHTVYQQEEISFEPGDLLAAFTDGVTEPENSYGEEFGDSRLSQIIRASIDSPAKLLAEEVYRAVSEWTGGGDPQDDMTMVYLRAAHASALGKMPKF